MAATKSPAPGWDRRGALGQTVQASGDQELPSSTSLSQRTAPPRRPVRPRVVLDSGLVAGSGDGSLGRRLFWLEATDENGQSAVVADSFSVRDLQWLALQYQRAGWLVVDRTGGAS